MELLAPAGNFECVCAAVDSGADAVYCAGQSFGARSFAGNLTDDEIFSAAEYCHLRGARIYLTVNTLLFDREFSRLDKFIRVLTDAAVDGVIVQDLGVLKYIRQLSPDIELHASTQMTVHSADGVRELERLGVCRTVLSRELSFDEIREISENVNSELEVFVHGAMCMSYSGQCLMSSVIGGRSGNRGKCAQPCRLTYKANGRERHYMSLKDMSLAEHLSKLKEIGIASLKIEGRMKSAAYVSTVTGIYRRLIDENRLPTGNERRALSEVFDRGGLTDGYFKGETGKKMFAFDRADNPYLKNSGEYTLPPSKTRGIDISAKFSEGDYPKLKFGLNKISVEVSGDSRCQSAQKIPITAESAKTSLEKLGGTPFYAQNTKTEICGNPYLSVSELNTLRRKATMALEAEILSGYGLKRIESAENAKIQKNAKRLKKFSCSVLNAEQYRAVSECDFERIYIPMHIAEQNLDEICRNTKMLKKTALCPPVIINGTRRDEYKRRLSALKDSGFGMVEVSTIDDIELADGFELCGGFRLNITNGLAAETASELGLSSICLSTELNTVQMHDISPECQKEAVVYGRIPLMITKNCIIKNIDGCPCDGNQGITDRTDRFLPIIKDGDICASVVLNSVPLYMADKPNEVEKINADLNRLMFTFESGDECIQIYNEYKNGAEVPSYEFTRLRMMKPPLG